jgi:putative FmdB family regulatory protein
MPLYEYRCHECGGTFEVLQKFSDEPLKLHPECGGVVERLISTSALQFKGSGWYVTDYAKNGKSSANGSSADSKSSEKSSGKSASEKPKSEAPKSDAPKTGK